MGQAAVNQSLIKSSDSKSVSASESLVFWVVLNSFVRKVVNESVGRLGTSGYVSKSLTNQSASQSSVTYPVTHWSVSKSVAIPFARQSRSQSAGQVTVSGQSGSQSFAT